MFGYYQITWKIMILILTIRRLYRNQTSRRYDSRSRKNRRYRGYKLSIRPIRFGNYMSPGQFDNYVLRTIRNPGRKPFGISMEDHVINSVVNLIHRGRIKPAFHTKCESASRNIRESIKKC